MLTSYYSCAVCEIQGEPLQGHIQHQRQRILDGVVSRMDTKLTANKTTTVSNFEMAFDDSKSDHLIANPVALHCPTGHKTQTASRIVMRREESQKL